MLLTRDEEPPFVCTEGSSCSRRESFAVIVCRVQVFINGFFCAYLMGVVLVTVGQYDDFEAYLYCFIQCRHKLQW